MEEKNIDQSQLAEDVSSKINYELGDPFLVKPLDKIKVMKDFSVPVAKDTEGPVAENSDEEVKAIDYDTVATETKEVDSDYRKGIVLKVPFSYAARMKDNKWPAMEINVGDTVIYKETSARWFDLLKDSQLLSAYDIVAKETK